MSRKALVWVLGTDGDEMGWAGWEKMLGEGKEGMSGDREVVVLCKAVIEGKERQANT